MAASSVSMKEKDKKNVVQVLGKGGSMCKPTGYEETRREWNKIKYGRTGEINSSKICSVACLQCFEYAESM